ncbi:MAG: tRNA threonylcarbamoyl adenosine modification protein (Sua5/YciO/YrdC/YwlC family) [Saprospiraceae bacterium]|jgi:tRNA threonylcarbamoyl adenosine modification protein (Sua5/YciO/YrdC/YwlC family)
MQRVILRPDNPDSRDIKMIADKMNKGAVVIFPTDTVYAMGCIMTNKGSIDRIIKISGKKEKLAKLSLICKDIKTVADFTLPYSNHIFKSMKRYLPGPYTFILNANNYVTKYFKNNKKEIGIRIPNNKIVLELMEYLDAPMISTSLNNDAVTEYFIDPEKIEDTYMHQVDYLIDGGLGEAMGSTILDCTSGEIEVIRMGKGEVD